MSQVSCGIVGLPNSGKSTLFNALLKKQIAQVGEYPYTTVEPNVGVVEVPDRRLDRIADVIAGDPSTSLRPSALRTSAVSSVEPLRLEETNRPQIIPAAIRFIDIAGLIKGAHKGEGLGNQFLAKIREVDAIIHVVRAFENPQVEHVGGKIDPEADIRSVYEELKLGGIAKPAIFVINAGEQDLATSLYHYNEVIDSIERTYGSKPIIISAKLEAELSELGEEDQGAYLKELGIEKSGIDQVIRQSYKLLDLITFFTVAGGRQIQAWAVKSDTKMVEAAQIVHTDMARGFIAAEVVNWQKLVDAGSWQEAKSKGLVKTIGKSEVMPEDMVVEFKFSV